MAVLSDSARAAVWAQLMKRLSGAHEGIALTKTDFRAAVPYNNALPLIARTNLTASQKAMLLAYVVLKRYTG